MNLIPRWLRHSLARRRNLIILSILAGIILLIWYTMPPSLESELRNWEKERKRAILDVNCFANHPYVLFFNRIPKSGSTTLQDFFRSLSTYVDVETDIHPEGAGQWSRAQVEEVEERAKSLLRRAKLMHGGHGSEHYSPRGIYIQHFYYTEFPGLTSLGMHYGYITLMRDPVDRAISAYHYYHFTKNFEIPAEQKQAPLLECIRKELFGCEANLMTQYFCGHEDKCVSKNGGHKFALEMAKQNLLQYIAVGITEEFMSSVKLFKKLLPDILPRFVELPETIKKKNMNEIDYMNGISDSDRAVIRDKNYLDMELYAFAKDLFEARLRACSLAGFDD